MDQAQMVGIAIGLGALAIFLFFVFIKANIVICHPNEVLILSGRKRRAADGTTVGYRVIRGGRGFKWPFLESVSRLSLNTRTIEVHPHKALCQGMIPVEIEGRANVKLAGREEAGLENAIERFLGKGPDAVDKTSQQVLEGALRGVIAKVSPEEANAQRLDLAQEVKQQAQAELAQLGIVLDFFQIHDISDEHGYLEAIGRQRNAQVRRDAKIAEAESEADARVVAAEQKMKGRDAEIASEMEIIQKENALAVEKADLLAKANEAEERAAVAGRIARIEAEIAAEEKRVARAKNREEANTLVPARARKEAMELEAQGSAAKILEDGKATAEAVELMRAQWEDGDTQELFLIRMFPELVDKVTRTVADNLNVERLTILDSGEGGGIPGYVKNITNSAVVMMEQMKNATGVDLARIAKRAEEGSSEELPKELG
jgi:flotillin